MILILMVLGARAVISFCILSAIPGYMVVPPDVTLHNGVVGCVMDTTGLHAKERWLEEGLRAPEALITNGNDLSVGKLIGLLQGGGCSSCGHLLLKVKCDITQFLLDVSDNLTLGSGGERVATFSEDLH